MIRAAWPVPTLDEMLLIATILIAAALPAAWATRRILAIADAPPMLRRLAAWMVPWGAWIWLAWSLMWQANLPRLDWNACRLAPVVGMLYGYKLYYPPEQGPLNTHIYGPVWALAMLPAGIAAQLGASVTMVIVLGGLLTLIWCVGPLLWMVLRGGEHRLPAALAAVACALWTIEIPSLTRAAYWVHVDAVALGLGGMAIAVLLRDPAGEPLRPRPALASACLAALAIWTKQTLAPLAVALPILAAIRDGRRAGCIYAAAIVAALAGLGLLFALGFGAGPMWFNMVQVPSRHPLRGGGYLAGMLDSVIPAAKHCTLPLLGLLLGVLLGAPASGHRFLSQRLRANAWTIPATVAVALAPTALLGYAKVGGDINNFAQISYFLLAAAGISLAEATTQPQPRARRATLGLGLFAVAAVIAVGSDFTLLRNLLEGVRSVSTNRQQLAWEFARSHPQQVYFPWNTLSTLLAEGRLYHCDGGIVDRRLAGYPPSPQHLRACMPAALRWIAIPLLAASREICPPDVPPVSLPQLPGYEVYIVPAPEQVNPIGSGRIENGSAGG